MHYIHSGRTRGNGNFHMDAWLLGRIMMKEIVDEYGGIISGLIIGVSIMGMIGSILYASLSGSINHFTTILYG